MPARVPGARGRPSHPWDAPAGRFAGAGTSGTWDSDGQWPPLCNVIVTMTLDDLLERCQRLEERAAALYRGYAAATRAQPRLCALWTALAREEEEHAHSLALAHRRREATAGWQTRLDGWAEAIDEVDERLADAEALEAYRVVGVQDRFAETVDALGVLPGFGHREIFRVRINRNRPSRSSLDPELVSLISRHNWLDEELYRLANERLDAAGG